VWQVLPSVGDKTPKFRFRGELYSCTLSQYFPSSYKLYSIVSCHH